jgi:hypothetical protein
MAEFVYGFLHGARPEPGIIGAESQAMERDYGRPPRGIGKAEDKIQTIRVQVAIGDREDRTIPTGSVRLLQERVGRVSSPARVVGRHRQLELRPELRVHAKQSEVVHEIVEFTSRNILKRHYRNVESHDGFLFSGSRGSQTVTTPSGTRISAVLTPPCTPIWV